jgi:hypothetical protein
MIVARMDWLVTYHGRARDERKYGESNGNSLGTFIVRTDHRMNEGMMPPKPEEVRAPARP